MKTQLSPKKKKQNKNAFLKKQSFVPKVTHFIGDAKLSLFTACIQG